MKCSLLIILAAFQSDAFTANRCVSRSSKTSLNAADGPPQYDKFQATLREAEQVGEGSFMLHIDTEDIVEYEPGHVLALEMEAPKGDDVDKVDSKTSEDTKQNGGWMRGPYTVSRSTDKSIDILVKVVGEKSKLFSIASPGTPLQFGGKFKVPILEGIDTDTTKRVVLISTGVGVGPCVGAIEKALEQESFPPIDLIASYRTEGEIVYKDHLDKLQTEHVDKFSWKAIITSEQGRMSSTADSLRVLNDTNFNARLEDTHYHLIGNGSMVSDFKAGLQKAGVADDKVTVEMYFNHKAEVDADAVSRIAAAVALETAAIPQ
ncbi:hypothetical protein ACHAWT_000485 [Skeletonema menzelii]